VQVSGLTSGNYRVIAYAHSSVSGTFNNLKAADITVVVGASIPAMALDVPVNNAVISGSFSVGGWAVDLGSSSGTGVNAVDVYAFPVVGTGFGAPTYLGPAVLGANRPDLAGFFGARFGTAGFNLQVSGLAAGRYRLVVYARSSVSGTFNNLRFADITIN
jgi:hypothetical protein